VSRTDFIMKPRLSLLALLLALRIFSGQWEWRIAAATPQDFGYGTLKVNGKAVAGGFPLLLVTFELSTSGNNRLPLRTDANTVFDTLVFGLTNFPSLNGFYLENSQGAFYWLRASVLGPVELDANETATLDAQQSIDSSDGVNRTGLDCGAGIAYLLGRIAAKTGYDFAQWDRNHDGAVTQDELSIMVIGNNGQSGGANRLIGTKGAGFPVPGQNVTLSGKVASLDHHASFMSITHELSHSLGTVDLYNTGCWNSGLTLMSCTIYPVLDDRRTFDLDPWHRILFGWVTPQIFELKTGGIATISVPQFPSANTPVILYDSARGTSEYFIAEFRNNQLANPRQYDLNLTDSASQLAFTGAAAGMALWHVAGSTCPPGQTKNCPAVFHEGASALVPGGNTLWNGQTPPLQWNDGTVTLTRLNTLGVGGGGYDLTFEWLTAAETWVDFAYAGAPVFPEDGTFAAPFNTLAKGVSAASRGGILRIKSGSSGETPTITKPLLLQAVGGPVTLGR
jgi:M6 family metalloprotease-like protein